MSTSDWRARDQDRDAAIETVEAAWADGQIVEADRDHRVEALRRAQTLAESLDSKGTSPYERLDLASVDTQPTSWYAILRAPDPNDGASICVYASNDYNESAYLSAERDGTVIHDSTKQ